MTIKGSYLSFSGYHIPIKNLKKEQIAAIKKDLTVKPLDSGFSGGGNEELTKYNVYKQTEDYITIPRYYGISKFGQPEKIEFDQPNQTNQSNQNLNQIAKSDGVGSDLKFTGVLRDYQKTIVDTCLKHVKKNGGGMLVVHCGAGKCMSKGTQIIMYDGSIKLVEDIKVGDVIMGDDSTPRNILGLARGQEEMFDVCENGKKIYTVNRSHILSLKNISNKIEINNKIYLKNEIIDISVNDYLKFLELCNLQNINSPLRGYRTSLDFVQNNSANKNINMNYQCDPYTYGNLIAEQLVNQFDKINKIDKIDNNFKCNSRKIRTNLLAGIIDKYYKLMCHTSINFMSGDCQSVNLKIPNNQNYCDITNDIIYIARSLGLNCSTAESTAESTDFVNLTISFADLTYQITLESIGIGDYYGFEIDGNKRFVLGDFTVTHNTSMAIFMATVLQQSTKKPTLVLTHKSFLLDQWVDRIKQFTNAKVGVIRQDVVDVENKDFVIGMIQSISKRDYDPEIFKHFGLVCIDECHRFGSKHFSNALYKVGAKYTIALTATPKRSDGLMKVVNWFVGDIMFEKKLQINNQVMTKVIGFLSTDKLFKDVMTVRKIQKCGRWTSTMKPDFVKMISNLIEIEDRNNLIISILCTLIKNPDRKILVLSERICHLEKLKDDLDKKIKESVESCQILEGECKTHFYIGKLKKNQREKAEIEADVLFGSYKMAEEGLDIERLNTLILATPKPDVVQSCGRILRKINEDAVPLIIDISDKLSVFESQAKKRQDYYTKCKYLQHFYYTQNGKLISPRKYLELIGNPNPNVHKHAPKSLDDVLEIPEIDIIGIEDDDKPQSNQSDQSDQSECKPKKIKKNKIKAKSTSKTDQSDSKVKKNKNKKKQKVKSKSNSDQSDCKQKKPKSSSVDFWFK